MTDYTKLSSAGVRWRVMPELVQSVRRGSFADWASILKNAEIVKDLRSKRTLEYRDGETTWIIKTYKPGSVWKRLASAVRGSRARRELKACQFVMRAGIPTVPVSALAEWKGGSAVLFEKLEGWTSLEELLKAKPEPSLLAAYGRFCRRVLDAGILQDDFNPSNVLIKGQELKLIDFERMRVGCTLSQTQRLRLIAKLIRLPFVGPSGIQPFLEGYLGPEESRERTLSRILRYAQRQSRIDRARLARNCLKENRNFGRLETERYIVFYRKSHPGQAGLSAQEATALAESHGPYRLNSHNHVLKEWREANLRHFDGGAVPLAVLRRRGDSAGFIAYSPQIESPSQH